MAFGVTPFVPLSRTTWRNSVPARQLVTGPAEAEGLRLCAHSARTVTKAFLPGASRWAAGRGFQALGDGGDLELTPGGGTQGREEVE